MTNFGFIEYPNGMNEHIRKFERDLEEAHFNGMDTETQEEILGEIRVAYRLYYMAKSHKPDALSKARRDCDRMVKSAHKVLDSISSITDPIEPHYDYWLRRNGMVGDLKAALKAHVEALYWTERQLDTVSKPGQQLETRARKQFKENLKAIFTRYNPPSETADFHDSLGAFIADTLEAFDL
jgi:hypothetical protein